MSEDTATNHSAKVTVYSTSWCAFCHTEMEWLEKLGIDFIKKDIEAEPAAKKNCWQKMAAISKACQSPTLTGN